MRWMLKLLLLFLLLCPCLLVLVLILVLVLVLVLVRPVHRVRAVAAHDFTNDLLSSGFLLRFLLLPFEWKHTIPH